MSTLAGAFLARTLEFLMSHYIQANTQGRLHAADEPSISPLSRGFLYGDAIYEVWRTYHGTVFAWDEHWQRLERSAKSLYMVLPFTQDQILSEIRKTVDAFRQKVPEAREVYIRLQITRGAGPIGLDIGLAEKPEFVLLVQENKLYSTEKFAAGLTLSLARTLRRNPAEALNPAWKTGNYLNNLLCFREAKARGADEVVILNQAGEVTEAAVCNIGFIRGGTLVTPPLDAGILPGITRRLLIEKVAPAAGVPVSEESVLPSDFVGFSECFLISTTKDLTPVAAIDECRFALKPDSTTLKLKAAFQDYAKHYAAAKTDLKLF